MKNVTRMITYANQFANLVLEMTEIVQTALMNSVIITQCCAYIIVTKTVTVKAKIISVTRLILYADQGVLQVKIVKNST